MPPAALAPGTPVALFPICGRRGAGWFPPAPGCVIGAPVVPAPNVVAPFVPPAFVPLIAGGDVRIVPLASGAIGFLSLSMQPARLVQKSTLAPRTAIRPR